MRFIRGWLALLCNIARWNRAELGVKNMITIIINIRVSSIAPEFPRTTSNNTKLLWTRSFALTWVSTDHVKQYQIVVTQSTQAHATNNMRYLTGIQSSFSHITHSEFELESSWIFKLLYTSLCILNIWLLQIFKYSTSPNIHWQLLSVTFYSKNQNVLRIFLGPVKT